jgi:rhamnose transport system permease protein
VTHERVLALLLAGEVILFSLTGRHFLSPGNAFDMVRQGAEVGLLALAMTPVIVSGGIDLSVGSLMGLSAVLFGKMWRDGHLPIPVSMGLTLMVGVLAGGVNALLITRFRIAPLIVTLGTFSLFRGLAEGLTRGVDNFTNFPEGFLFLGQGDLPGGIPPQLLLLGLATAGFWVLLHRTSIGRGLVAIGFSPEGARHAAIPVERRIALVYLLSGGVASLASILYVAHNGQAKADSGLEYELRAITAVVLGGASIFGGRGRILGTVLGLVAIVVLQQGLRLSRGPSELAGILTGALLIGSILIPQLAAKLSKRERSSPDSKGS